MWDALIVLSMGFIAGGAMIWLLSGAIFARFSQRCTKLERAVDDLEGRALSIKGKEMSERRWTKKATDDFEMAQTLQESRPLAKRFDNDPLG